MSETGVTVELSAGLARLIDPTGANLTRRVHEMLAVQLYHIGELSSGRASEILGISKDDFRDLLARYDLPYINYSPEELERELRLLEAARAPSEP